MRHLATTAQAVAITAAGCLTVGLIVLGALTDLAEDLERFATPRSNA